MAILFFFFFGGGYSTGYSTFKGFLNSTKSVYICAFAKLLKVCLLKKIYTKVALKNILEFFLKKIVTPFSVFGREFSTPSHEHNLIILVTH